MKICREYPSFVSIGQKYRELSVHVEVRLIASRRNTFTLQVFAVQQPIFLYC